jgi:ADP-ribose pyrophosphatase
LYYYLASDLFEAAATPDEDESIEVMRVSIDQAKRMVEDGGIEDSKTALGICLAGEYLKIGNR